MATDPDRLLLLAYLGVLRGALGDTPTAEELLRTAEDSLSDNTNKYLARGMSLVEAQRAAIAQFGEAERVAARLLGQPPAPIIHDARDGLTPPAVDLLMHATQLALALRGGRTATLGVWLEDRLASVLLVGRRDARAEVGGLPLAARTSPVATRLLDTNASAAWRNVIRPALHVGMLVEAESWDGTPRLWFGPFVGGSPTASQLCLTFNRPRSRRAPRLNLG